MNISKYNIREYRDSDYPTCEKLVSDAWQFDENFKPKKLADIARLMYTKGSLINANFYRVAELAGKVVGFIFGLNENGIPPKKSLLFGIEILLRILFVIGMPYKEKSRLLKAITTHVENRLKLAKPGRSEIMLFVVDPAHQGAGLGKRLFSEFLDECKETEVESIIVETNTKGASTFYEGIGFELMDYFDSPLHEYATKNGRAVMCQYRLLRHNSDPI